MPRAYGQKLKLICLADIFRKQTDEQHPLAVREIISLLSQLGINAERKAIYNDIELLRDVYGMDICQVNEGAHTKYFLASGAFELAELQLLADAVACARFITESKSKELIAKLEGLTSVYMARALSRSVIVANRAKTINEHIYYNIQALHEAIKAGRKISFLYFDYDIKKRKVYRSGGRPYEMSPFTLAWEDESYYCIGYYEKYDTVSSFRVDRMEDVRMLEDEAVTDADFNITDYSKRVFGMFHGETVRAKLLFDNSLVNVVMDRFGSDITMYKADEGHFYINRRINASPTFFGWISQFGGKAAILAPQKLKDEMKEHLYKVISSLEKESEN